MGEQYMILGYRRVTGEYEGRPFDNYNFYVQVMDEKKQPDAGIAVDRVKVKTDVVLSSGVAIGPQIVGNVLAVAYNRYGTVSDIKILTADDLKK